MTDTEQKAILTLCLMAAFADGQDERERAQIKRIADSLAPGSALDLAALYQDVLLKRRTLEQVAAELTNPESQAARLRDGGMRVRRRRCREHGREPRSWSVCARRCSWRRSRRGRSRIRPPR